MPLFTGGRISAGGRMGKGRLKQAAILVVCLVAAGAGAALAGLKNQSWLILAGTGVCGVLIQILTSRFTDRPATPPSNANWEASAPLLRQLPVDLPDFVGRKQELSALQSVRGRAKNASDVDI